ncbi:homocysteine S-methyltransferase family protein [Shimia sp. NS0008-38b]|uniref:homocysteine S-methyltransferase family protein n=1 Tax=Shimia sp. NS0008-38b TaxID=3127653 RepID=UPI00310A59EE
MRRQLPHEGTQLFLTYTGMETDLIFTQGVDLPGFASFPLLETAEGRRRLLSYVQDLAKLAQATDMGVIFESTTWVANADRGHAIGYRAADLDKANRDAIAFLVEARSTLGDVPTLISANIGPRADAYAPQDRMTPEQAAAYHATQIATLTTTQADLITGYTLAYPNEAIGILQAAKAHSLPCIIAFTVEMDGRLPTGDTLEAAITAVDAATNGYASYFMINCAHPDHFADVLTNAPWAHRVQGIVANASRCSHAELDNATELDAGNPTEFGAQLAALRHTHRQLRVLGGCCGTDMRHLGELAGRL